MPWLNKRVGHAPFACAAGPLSGEKSLGWHWHWQGSLPRNAMPSGGQERGRDSRSDPAPGWSAAVGTRDGCKVYTMAQCDFCQRRNVEASGTQCCNQQFYPPFRGACWDCVVSWCTSPGANAVQRQHDNAAQIRDWCNENKHLLDRRYFNQFCHQFYVKGTCAKGDECFRQHGIPDSRTFRAAWRSSGRGRSVRQTGQRPPQRQEPEPGVEEGWQ